MPHAFPAKTTRTFKTGAAAPILAMTLALMLAGCGSDKVEEELLQRVATAEAAAARADAARIRAEKAVETLGSSEFADEGEGGDETEEAEGEESLDVAPDDQGIESETVAPPAPAAEPTGRMPA